MKLSKKGKSRIHEMIDCAFEAHPDDAKGVQVLAKKYLTECDDFELQPDDFEGVVCLTVEEAKVIASFFGAVDACCDLRMSKTEQKTWCKLNKRIEQVEKDK